MTYRHPANWAGNVVFSTREVHQPRTVAELQELVARSPRVRAVGTAHSFSRIADTDGVLVSLAGLAPVMDIDSSQPAVRVSAGARYGELAQYLNTAGYALHNLASLPHISVAGSCATATHGSGNGNGNLATAVSAMELVTADGEIVTLRRADGAAFRGAVVGLGAFGVVITLDLGLVPAFGVEQYVYEDLPADQVASHVEEIFASAYSVSLFTSWRGSRHDQLWVKQRTGDPLWPGFAGLGGRPADGPRHPIPGMDPANCTEQLGVPGPWHERLPHFRLAFTPSSGDELQSEYLLPRRQAAAALELLAGLASRISPVLQVSEIRTVAPDDLLMSPSYQRETVGFHFTWISDVGAVLPVITAVEDRLLPLGARPHWGKLFTVPAADVRAAYPAWEEFRALLHRYDPAGRFRNEFTGQYFPPAETLR